MDNDVIRRDMEINSTSIIRLFTPDGAADVASATLRIRPAGKEGVTFEIHALGDVAVSQTLNIADLFEVLPRVAKILKNSAYGKFEDSPQTDDDRAALKDWCEALTKENDALKANVARLSQALELYRKASREDTEIIRRLNAEIKERKKYYQRWRDSL